MQVYGISIFKYNSFLCKNPICFAGKLRFIDTIRRHFHWHGFFKSSKYKGRRFHDQVEPKHEKSLTRLKIQIFFNAKPSDWFENFKTIPCRAIQKHVKLFWAALSTNINLCVISFKEKLNKLEGNVNLAENLDAEQRNSLSTAQDLLLLFTPYAGLLIFNCWPNKVLLL